MPTETMTTQSVAGAFKQAAGLSIGYAVLMIVLGVLAVAVPQATGVGVAMVVAWITIFGGLAHLAYAFAAESAGTVLWRLLIGSSTSQGASILRPIRASACRPSRWCSPGSFSLKA